MINKLFYDINDIKHQQSSEETQIYRLSLTWWTLQDRLEQDLQGINIPNQWNLHH